MLEIPGVNKLQLFMATYMPDVFTVDASKMQAEMSALFVDDTRKRIAIDAFRGSAKSTYLSRGFLTYCVAETKLTKIYHVSRTAGEKGLSTQWMRMLQREITDNVLLKADYQLRKGKKWNEDYCQIIRPDGTVCEVYALGKGSSIRGARDLNALMIFDDLQDAEDQRSEAVIASDELWFVQDVLPIPLPDQRMIIIGQNLSPASLMARIENMPSWEYYRFPLEEPIGSGKSVWPAMWSDEWIVKQKADMGLDEFNAEYNCTPRISGNPIFRKDWVKYFDRDSALFQRVLNNQLYTVIGFDGADSKATNADYTAMVVGSSELGDDPNIYIRSGVNEHYTTPEAIAKLANMKKDFDGNKCIVESRVKQGNRGPYEVEIEAYENLHGEVLNVEIVRPEKDKATRALYVQSLLQRGKVFFDDRDETVKQLILQMCMFTGGTQKFKDDLVDAFVHMLTEIKNRAGNFSDSGKPRIVLPGRRREVEAA